MIRESGSVRLRLASAGEPGGGGAGWRAAAALAWARARHWAAIRTWKCSSTGTGRVPGIEVPPGGGRSGAHGPLGSLGSDLVAGALEHLPGTAGPSLGLFGLLTACGLRGTFGGQVLQHLLDPCRATDRVSQLRGQLVTVRITVKLVLGRVDRPSIGQDVRGELT